MIAFAALLEQLLFTQGRRDKVRLLRRFFASQPDTRALRLSFVTSTPEQIDKGMAALAQVVRQAIAG